ncbi:hypothetical protein LTR70_007700 [Exophiala xenobiotica]|uniref:AB hydrolase-1 domain-containing protein n=1 Tax=Lithohypha guttulata TaxID=1690604 RepID=A0ABR0K3X2_9EURO|nr:hypothetical protein LTR24_007286 [Lithohypha guttulata]KAK5313291.1 hypothetical protein LTR70_007700 [Exophiala xenobiotica]
MATQSASSHHDHGETYLDFASYDDSASATTILIHGVSASGSDWSLVQPYLCTYHLLTPSLFTQHSLKLARSLRESAPGSNGHLPQLSWQASYVVLMAALIRRYAKNGKAHIVGLSLGGNFAMALAAAHPDLSLSLFVSGLPRLISNAPALALPLAKHGIWATQRLIEMLPLTTHRKLLDGEVDADPGGSDGVGGKTSLEEVQIVVETVTGGYPVPTFEMTERSDTSEPSFRARVVAATRSKWFMLTTESSTWAIEAGSKFAGRPRNKDLADYEGSGCVDLKVFEAKRMFHPWNRQDPELFAKSIIATIEGLDFPAGDMREVLAS